MHFHYKKNLDLFGLGLGQLSDMQTSGKSVEEQIFTHFFLQLCASHSPEPLPSCSLNEHLAPA